MICPPYTLCWIDELCYWILLNRTGYSIRRSLKGFPSEDEAIADFIWWNSH